MSTRNIQDDHAKKPGNTEKGDNKELPIERSAILTDEWIEKQSWFSESCRQFINSSFYKKAISDPNYTKLNAARDFFREFINSSFLNSRTLSSHVWNVTDITPKKEDVVQINSENKLLNDESQVTVDFSSSAIFDLLVDLLIRRYYRAF
ncbi:hypothetical protein QNI19_31870 [Cytophagaceae bacterium DM2B3-1]|uniref:Uncharacterized protein n=1 Tax=Xanthocytophaga flava TaxID=3048013 RepID=A0ABT7CUY0_9BACT|nr:hypothetical protein [Xanthocytophaga flavus]MDJ1497580.1 hypothetical protein [Xanthocytophaga flavus]